MAAKNTNDKTIKKNIHAGHRQRLKGSVDRDPEMNTFSDIEILEYFLTFVIPRRDTNPIAHELINQFGTLYNVFRADYEELTAISGITKNAACFITKVFPIMDKIYFSNITKRDVKVSNFYDAVNVFSSYFSGDQTEQICLLCLDVHENLINIETIYNNTMKQIPTISSIVSLALKNNAVAVILGHNNPQGDWRINDDELRGTNKLYESFKTFDIILADNIVFTRTGYLSFYMSGIMPFGDNLSILHQNFYSYKEQRKPKNTPSYFTIK